MSKKETILFGAQIIIGIFMFIFSYGYVDLNLTLTQNPLIIKIISNLQHFSYYERPTTTLIYSLIYTFWFFIFTVNMVLFKKGKLSLRYLKTTILVLFLVLVLSYPFLSSDLFNYLFDAKIMAHYHASPYITKPLDYPGDEWLRFMRWTHRYSPYGPVWLLMSIIPFMLGFGKFLLTLFSFKIFIALFHLINALIIYKILSLVKPSEKLTGTAFYALNPLFLTEGIINAHNDVIVASSILLTSYLLFKKNNFLSYLTLLFGTFIKYIPILIVPWLILYSKGRKIHVKSFSQNYKLFIYVCLITFALFTFIYSTFGIKVPFVSASGTQVQYQPWYLFWTLPLIAIIPSQYLLTFAIVLSFGSIYRYLPFLYYGDWSHPGVILFMKTVTLLPAIVMILLSFIASRNAIIKNTIKVIKRVNL